MTSTWHTNLKHKHQEEILKAGTQLFLEYHFSGINIQQICDVVGISRVTFYKYFKSLDELVFEVAMNILKNMTEFIKAGNEDNISGKESLRSLLYSWIDFAKEHGKELRFIMFFDLYYKYKCQEEELAARFERFIKEGFHNHFLEEIISKGIQDGSLKPDVDAFKMSVSIFQTMMGLLQRLSSTPPSIPDARTVELDEIASTVADMILDSISNPA
ncbi:TetR/AcrR family transcriptional regulator [Paenibacillus kribbensis]|uniref:TetR/AcrR family transcriptional regulator n=1 Tax=Paenibacillus kribbensis TaxID=172713 RepID=UPI002DBAD972|nr:TetR/AcrR family transcriptional regulator [Paenibacillus kribbensis]MEC0234889.1 TetR/AcrR family transcriptional regulator [Paenibacillus kribbensis]